jgi:hypothetical protein
MELQRNKLYFTKEPTCNTFKSALIKDESYKFKFDSYHRNNENSGLSDNKKFNFSIKPSNNQDRKKGIFNFKKVENFQNKMANDTTKNEKLKLDFIEFNSDSKPTSVNLNQNSFDAVPCSKEYNNNERICNPSVENKNIISKEGIEEYNKVNVQPIPVKNENKKFNDLDDLFEIFNNHNNIKNNPHVESKNEFIKEQAEIKNFSNDMKSSFTYPNFAKISELELPVLNASMEHLTNEEKNKNQPNHMINDIDDLFV